MDKIRVLLANHHVMVPDAIRELLEEQEDMEVVGDCRGPMKILQETGRVNADAVILAQEGTEEPGLCSQLLSVYPDLTILSLASDVGAAFTQQLRSHRQDVTSCGRGDVIQALRRAVKFPYGKT